MVVKAHKPEQKGPQLQSKHLRALVFLAFSALVVGVWFALAKKFNVDKAPSSFSVVERFERDGVPSLSGYAYTGGSAVNTAEISAPVLILNFWASWCDPCVEEFSSMLELVEKMKGKVAVVAISQDENEEDMKTFLNLFKVPRPGFYVISDKERAIGAQFAVSKLPESFIAGPDRKLVRKVLGVENWASEPAIQYFSDLAARKK